MMLTMFDFNELKLLHLVFALLIMTLGYWIAKWISMRIAHIVEKYMSKHEGMICRRLTFYASMLLFLIAALQQLGFKLGVLLGAAGIFTVGIGFAAQTSLANLISGIFLLIERPFKVGDKIIAKGFTGVVDSIDLLSTRLCTIENTLVRIPNENIMQAEIINLSYFPKRVVNIIIGVAYGTDMTKVREVFLQVANDEALALMDPLPTIAITEFGASTINITLSVWGVTANYTDLKNALQEDIKIAFEKARIEMPFPQMTIHTVNHVLAKSLDKNISTA